MKMKRSVIAKNTLTSSNGFTIKSKQKSANCHGEMKTAFFILKKVKSIEFFLLFQFLAVKARERILLNYANGLYLFSLFVPRFLVRKSPQCGFSIVCHLESCNFPNQ